MFNEWTKDYNPRNVTYYTIGMHTGNGKRRNRPPQEICVCLKRK